MDRQTEVNRLVNPFFASCAQGKNVVKLRGRQNSRLMQNTFTGVALNMADDLMIKMLPSSWMILALIE